MTDEAGGVVLTAEEYEARYNENYRVTGFGPGTTTHLPCPFCAAKNWLVHRIMGTQAALAKGAVCRECHRGARAIYRPDKGGVSIEFVQTCGEPPADYLPKMRMVVGE